MVHAQHKPAIGTEDEDSHSHNPEVDLIFSGLLRILWTIASNACCF